MKQEYISLFEKAAPRMSDEELLNSVLSSRKGSITMKNTENKSKKRFSKAVVIPLAAALALGATAVGAVAVYSHNTAEEYARALQLHGDAFPQEYKNADGKEVNQNAMTLNNGLYDELNIEINKTFEYEDFTLEFPGAICDGEDILIVYNIVFNKDLKCLEHPYQHFDIWGRNDGNGAQGGGHRLPGRDFSERDGKTVYTSFYDFFGVGNCGDTLTVKFTELSSCAGMNGIGIYEADIDVTLEIPLTNDFSKFSKTFEADDPQHIDLADWCEWDIESADLRALSISFNAKTDGEVPEDIFDRNEPIFPIIVTMKDGSTLELDDVAIWRYYDYPENNAATFTALLNYPIEVENVQSVQFASAVIDADGGSSTVEIPELVERYKPID